VGEKQTLVGEKQTLVGIVHHGGGEGDTRKPL
jgi:hypothetical protein